MHYNSVHSEPLKGCGAIKNQAGAHGENTMRKTYQPGRVIMGKLRKGADLLESLNAVAAEEGVKMGTVEAIGAVSTARVGFYEQRRRVYEYFEVDGGELEILSCIGNISLRQGAPMVHAHIVLGDASGMAKGGHLAEGTSVFACEYVIRELLGDELNRTFDEATGLPLWGE